MTSPRQLFTSVSSIVGNRSSLRLGAAAIALGALGGCAGLPGMQSGPTIIAGTHQARNDALVQQLHNGWQVAPTSTATLTARNGQPVPLLRTNGAIILKRPVSEGEATLFNECSRLKDPSFHSQCVTLSPPSHIVYELSPQLVYARVTCGPATLQRNGLPGLSGSETYLRRSCSATGSYDVKSPSIQQRSRIAATTGSSKLA